MLFTILFYKKELKVILTIRTINKYARLLQWRETVQFDRWLMDDCLCINKYLKAGFLKKYIQLVIYENNGWGQFCAALAVKGIDFELSWVRSLGIDMFFRKIFFCYCLLLRHRQLIYLFILYFFNIFIVYLKKKK